MAGYVARHGMNRVFHFDVLGFQFVGHFAKRVLGLCDGYVIVWYDDHFAGVLHDEGCVVGRV